MTGAPQATYRHDDPDALVLAALACRWCLAGPEALTVVEDTHGGVVFARCVNCTSTTAYRLAPAQVARLISAQPWGVQLELV